MIAKLRKLINDHWDIVMYLVFGVLTTAVNWIVYFPLYNIADFSATVSTAVSWSVAVAFAFLTNKPFVFKSNDWSSKGVVPELIGFVGCRIGSGLIEAGLIFLTVDILHWNGNFMKVLLSIIVVLINYVGSKLLFKENK